MLHLECFTYGGYLSHGGDFDGAADPIAGARAVTEADAEAVECFGRHVPSLVREPEGTRRPEGTRQREGARRPEGVRPDPAPEAVPAHA
ncbi:hypothetical protein [Streptomyces sp. NRRL S-31]|uniref:hypothetical protein n=1 Tax=Streptomyces sp. NRRL S-31 TaxID=1463898 RepID=UPI0004C586E3|nr:hypothetical protein [Streptomyces sp. NRRL S-31]